jgi:hypothetical protein
MKVAFSSTGVSSDKLLSPGWKETPPCTT